MESQTNGWQADPLHARRQSSCVDVGSGVLEVSDLTIADGESSHEAAWLAFCIKLLPQKHTIRLCVEVDGKTRGRGLRLDL